MIRSLSSLAKTSAETVGFIAFMGMIMWVFVFLDFMVSQ
jgi:hypothetical protein